MERLQTIEAKLLTEKEQLRTEKEQLQHVAAASPGRDSKNVHEFMKSHMDGKVITVHFSPLDTDWSKKYVEHLGVAVKNETEYTSEQVSIDPHSGKVTSVSGQEFLRLVYLSGGIPRYLHAFVTDYQHYLITMNDEMLKQLDDAENEYRTSVVSVVENITRIALGQDASDRHVLVKCGIAYIRTDNKCYLTSPFYMFKVVKEEGLRCSQGAWKELELLTVFLLKHTDCSISNSKQSDMSIPRVGQAYEQTVIGEFPLGKVQDTIISLASGHPVIDTIVVSATEKKLYFIQTSFSKYSVHRKKRADLKKTRVTKEGSTVDKHYTDKYKGFKTVYVYATPQSDSSSDVDVYFWDCVNLAQCFGGNR